MLRRTHGGQQYVAKEGEEGTEGDGVRDVEGRREVPRRKRGDLLTPNFQGFYDATFTLLILHTSLQEQVF